MPSTLSAPEAAARLGVKVETLYAYVSRGILDRYRSADGRTSTFAAADVEALARRGRPRRATRPPAVDVSIETSLTRIHDHRLEYRGHDATALARAATFEQVAELLWTGPLPAASPHWVANDLALPPLPSLVDRLRVAVALGPIADPLRADLSPRAVPVTARALVATLVACLPDRGRPGGPPVPVEDAAGPVPARPGRPGGRPVPGLTLPAGGPVHRRTVAGLLWNRLAPPGRPRPGLVAALNGALVLLADHEMATSTLAARVAASTRADPYAAVAAGLAAVSGPLHGGASRVGWRLLDEVAAGTSGPGAAATALAAVVARWGGYPGFGHPLYPEGDPRAAALLDLVRAATPAGRSETLRTADAVIDQVRRRAGIGPNIDFALAVLARQAAMPEEAGEVIFTVARTAGWLAHAIEEYSEPPLRFRSRAVYLEPPARRP